MKKIRSWLRYFVYGKRSKMCFKYFPLIRVKILFLLTQFFGQAIGELRALFDNNYTEFSVPIQYQSITINTSFWILKCFAFILNKTTIFISA